jgi:hypothetical protein
MPRLLSASTSKLLGDLRLGGVPLDSEVVDEIRSQSVGLLIEQTGTMLESTVIALSSRRSGFQFSVAICNNSDRVICIDEFRLQSLWWEPNFQWVEDPLRMAPRRREYSFPACSLLGFERNAVLNHRVGRQGRLNPGAQMEGMLLGLGESSIPHEYRDRHAVTMRLQVFDSRGHSHECAIKFCIDRASDKLSTRKKQPGTSRFLFSKKDVQQEAGMVRSP